MSRVAIYCRLSDEDRDKINNFEDSESIQNQKNLLMKYAIEKGWEIFNIYSDDNYSGLDKDRPDFQRMLRDAQAGKFNIILCKHQSRFTRDMELVEKYLHNKFIEWNIRFVTMVDGVDTSDKFNKKSRQIGGLVNEWYSEDTSESIRAVIRLKQQQGKFIGAFASYGFIKDIKDKNKLIIDEEAADVIRKIYNLYLNGNGIQHIAYLLNQEKIPNPTKYKQLNGLNFVNSFAKDNRGLWNFITVKRILQNQMYIGNMVQHVSQKINYKSKKKINLPKEDWIIKEDIHPAIIDKKTFQMVQNIFETKVKSLSTGEVHLFAGKARCLDCSRIMQKTTNGSQQYLYCRTYRQAVSDKQCSRHSIKLNDLENIITEKIRDYILSIDDNSISAKMVKQLSVNEKKASLLKKRTSILKDIENRDMALKMLYLDKVKGIISESQFVEYTSTFKIEKEHMSKKVEEINKSIDTLNSELNNVKIYQELIIKYKNFDKLTRIMVNEFIDFIEIGEKNKKTKEQVIKIHWNF